MVDHDTIAELLEHKNSADGEGYIQMIDKKIEENEHSLEMHIPYIKKVF